MEYSMNEETTMMYDVGLTGVRDRQQRVPGLLQVRSRRKSGGIGLSIKMGSLFFDFQ